jgi:hypothetical protein
VLLEASLLAGFFLFAIPFGYLSRIVRRRLTGWPKWPAFLGVVHGPVVPLIIFVRLAGPVFEFELALVVFVLLGHTTGVLGHRHYNTAAPRSAATSAKP